MEQRKKEQDVLVVKDEQTGEIGVVAGLKRDGTPNMRAAKPEHEREFLRFDRHGDVLDNFFSNFFRQCKDPKRFSFYRVTAEGIENVLTVMKEMLKKPDEYKEVLDATASIRPSTSSRPNRCGRRRRMPPKKGRT